jgi:ring-1,2-phenylacetyl-CoA epoxidase subunit PaaA
MGEVVPFMDEMGLDVPVHHDGSKYVIDCPFPAEFDEEAKRWGDETTWEDVLARWKRRGPMNRDYVTKLQRGYRAL